MKTQISISAAFLIAAMTLSATQVTTQRMNDKSNGTLEIISLHFPDSIVFKPVEGVEILSSTLLVSFVSGTESFSPEYIQASGSMKLNFDGKPIYFDQTRLIALGHMLPVDFKPQRIEFIIAGNEMFYNIVKSEWEYPEFLKKYSDISYRDDGLIMVRLNGKTGLINSEGKEVMPCKYAYDHIERFDDGIARVRSGDKSGYIDKNGKEIVLCKYDSVGYFRNGVVMVRLDGKVGLIDKDGNEVIPCKYVYDKIEPFRDNLFKVKSVDKSGLIDESGKEIIPCKYDQVSVWNFEKGITEVELDSKAGLIGKDGKEIASCKYDDIRLLRDGVARITCGDKSGLIDESGKEVVPCRYDEITSLSDGYAHVKSDGKWGIVDFGNGNEIVSCKYDIMDTISDGSRKYCFTSDGFAPVRLKGKTIWVDRQGNEYVTIKKARKSLEKAGGR